MSQVAVSEYTCMDMATPQHLVRDFARPCPNNLNALAVELGAGAGRNLLFLSQLGYRVLAVESNTGHGKIHFPSDLILADEKRQYFEELGIAIMGVEAGLPEIEPGPAALVVAMNVIQFIPGERKTDLCRNISQWLAPNGRLIASVVMHRTSRSDTESRVSHRYTMDESTIRHLFSNLEIIHLEHVTAEVPKTVSWSSTAQIELIEFVCDRPA